MQERHAKNARKHISGRTRQREKEQKTNGAANGAGAVVHGQATGDKDDKLISRIPEFDDCGAWDVGAIVEQQTDVAQLFEWQVLEASRGKQMSLHSVLAHVCCVCECLCVCVCVYEGRRRRERRRAEKRARKQHERRREHESATTFTCTTRKKRTVF